MAIQRNERLTVDDVIEQLCSVSMGSSGVPSSLGPQLDRLRDGTTGGVPDAQRVASAMEDRLLRSAYRDRCARHFRELQLINFDELVDLRDFSHRAKMGEGAVAADVLTVFHGTRMASVQGGVTETDARHNADTAALAAVYAWMRTGVSSLPPVPLDGEDSVADVFRKGKGKRAREKAATLYADARIALGGWVERWNAKGAAPRLRVCA